MNIRHAVLGLIAPALLAGLVACGSDSGHTVGGTVVNSVGPVVLQLSGATTATVTATAAGAFTFPGGIGSGNTYTVSVSSSDQNCSVSNGAGTISGADVTNVTVTCTSVIRSANLSGASQNPAVTTAATGRGAVVVNPTTRAITGGMVFSGLTPNTGGHHIHQAPAGNPTANGPVIIPLQLAADGKSAVVPAGTVLTASQYTALLAGELYLNVHTAANPGGEIRGALSVKGGVTVALGTLAGTNEVPPNNSTASGRGTIVFDSTTLDVLAAYVTHNVASPSQAHIHTGGPGVNGPANIVVFATQSPTAYTATTPAKLTAQQASDVRSGNAYFNVHSTTFPGGEVRGQTALQ